MGTWKRIELVEILSVLSTQRREIYCVCNFRCFYYSISKVHKKLS